VNTCTQSQVYVALLRTFQPESRHLVRVALDVLLPALLKRLPLNEFVKAVKWTKKIIYEEGHTLAQLVHLWQLIVRHPWLFFPYKSQFLPQMVNSLNRLGLPPNCPVENRQLAVSLAEIIIVWELHRVRSEMSFCSTRSDASLSPLNTLANDRDRENRNVIRRLESTVHHMHANVSTRGMCVILCPSTHINKQITHPLET